MCSKGEDQLLVSHWLQEHCPRSRVAGVCLNDSDGVVTSKRSLWLRSALLVSRCMFRVDPRLPERFVREAVRRGVANKTHGSRAAHVFPYLHILELIFLRQASVTYSDI